MSCSYCKISPCKSCPYRKDAPLAHWHRDHFAGLLADEADTFGRVYSCHKKDNTVCTGWLMDQDKRDFPSIALRLSIIKNKVTKAFLDTLYCKSERYETVQEMIKANYPDML